MKISMLLPNIEVSGGNRANFELANALVDLGHEVNAFYPIVPGRDGLGYLNMRKTGVQIVKGVRNYFASLRWFPLKAKLQKVPYFTHDSLQKHLPEAEFVLFSWWAHATLIQGLPEKCGKPVHLVRSLEFWGGPEAKVEAAYRADMPKLVTSKALQSQLLQRAGVKAAIVSDGVDTEMFFPAKPVAETEQASSKQNLKIGVMYRRQKLKRMPDAIHVLQRVLAQHPEAVAVLFGETITREDKALLGQLPRWEYIKFPTGTHLRETYQSLDVFLFTSGPEEAFGLPPLEAMASGVAVVSTDVGAVREYAAHQTSAMIVPVGDVDALTTAVNQLLSDPTMRQNISRAARDRATNFSWRQSAERIQEVLLAL